MNASADAGVSPADLWAALSEVKDEPARAALVARCEAELQLLEAGAPGPARDEVERVMRAARRVQLEGAPFDPRGRTMRLVEASMGIGEPRPRDRAAREAFVLAEQTMRAEPVRIAERAGASQRPELALPPAPPSAGTARERAALREAGVAARRAAFAGAFRELALMAVPMDDDELLVVRASFLDEAGRALGAAGPAWESSPEASAVALEAYAGLSEDAPASPDEAAAIGAASALREGSAARAVAAAVQQRVLAAVDESTRRAASAEHRIAMLEGTEGSDPELRAARVRREVERGPTPLLEALFVRARRALAEAGSSADEGLVLAEAVMQYSILESLQALGCLPPGEATAGELAASVMAAR